jgi:sugar/nucleoside kinase (ribokinase family)
MVADLDALYVNFISGFEMCLGTAEALRQGFSGPIYADLHSLFLGMGADGIRMLRPLPNAPAWFAFFDMIQLNEEEMLQLGPDPLPIAADALGAGVSLLNVTVGARGVVYFAQPGFDRIGSRGESGGAVRTARLAPPATNATDTTGCGDVFGATCFGRLLAGDDMLAALAAANRAAARNATFRGASDLPRQLRGELIPA